MLDAGSPVRRPPSKGRIFTVGNHAMRAFHQVLVSSVTVPLLAAGTAVATSPDAEAATSCTVSLSGLPSKVTIDATDRSYWVKGTATGCAGVDKEWSWIMADAYGPNSTLKRTYSLIDAEIGKSSRAILDSSWFTAGKYTVLDDNSLIMDHSGRDIRYTWGKKSFTAKYRGYTTLSAKRSGSYVKLSGHVRRYSPSRMGYIGFRHKVSIQRYYSGAWHTIRTATPSSSGAYSYTYKTTKKSWYRAKTAETTTTLGDASGTYTVRAR